MAIDFVIRFAHADSALAQRIGRALGDDGHRVAWQAAEVDGWPELPPPRRPVRVLLLIWTARSVGLREMERLTRAGVGFARVLDVCVGAVLPLGPLDLPIRVGVSLADRDADSAPVLAEVRRWSQLRDLVALPARAPAATDPLVDFVARPGVAKPRSNASDDPFAALAGDRTVIKPNPLRRVDLWLDLPAAGSVDPLLPASPSLADRIASFEAFGSAAPRAVAEPVLLAASAPRRCHAGDGFTACLVAYAEAARESALRRLAQFGDDGDRIVSDVPPDGDTRWVVGAPVRVRLGGAGLAVSPAERRFVWNGRENAAAFAVTVGADAPPGSSVALCFEVSVADVPVAFIPLRLAVGAGGGPALVIPAQRAEAAAPRSLFASYASRDAQAVSQRLSTLTRWSPQLDIFQDCLDLVPNESFKPQLAQQIRARDVFVLFWSRHAAASPWVRWEIDTALAAAAATSTAVADAVADAGDPAFDAPHANGLPSILPMPLEDPAIAPPPAPFTGGHWRDRFLLAGYALARIDDLAGAPALAPQPAVAASPAR